jgi:hypothetical protein
MRAAHSRCALHIAALLYRAGTGSMNDCLRVVCCVSCACVIVQRPPPKI